MGKIVLSDEERYHLERWSESTNLKYSRRAQILLESAKGQTAPNVAQILGCSQRRVFFWRAEFRKYRMEIFLKKNQSEQNQSSKAPATQMQENIALTPKPLQAIGLKPTDSMAEAGRKVLAFYYSNMLANEEGTIVGEDIEALHDMRVATRRMRASWDVFGQYFKSKTRNLYYKGLRQIGRTLGPVRDLDVFIHKATLDILHLSESDQQDLQTLFDHWEQERLVARSKMVEFLQADTYKGFKDQFSEFLANPGRGVKIILPAEFDGQPVPRASLVQELAPVMIFDRLSVVKAYDSIIETASIVQLHALRIDIKRLHYTVNFFSEILRPEAKAALKIIKGMQDTLGELHDADVACLKLGQVLNNWESNQAGTALNEYRNPRALLNYLALKHQERHEQLKNIPESWRNFTTQELISHLATAIKAL